MKQLSFVIGGILLISATAAPAAPHRGVWFWNTTEVDGSDSPHSSELVVGPATGGAEDEAIAFMTFQGIKESRNQGSLRQLQAASQKRSRGYLAIERETGCRGHRLSTSHFRVRRCRSYTAH